MGAPFDGCTCRRSRPSEIDNALGMFVAGPRQPVHFGPKANLSGRWPATFHSVEREIWDAQEMITVALNDGRSVPALCRAGMTVRSMHIKQRIGGHITMLFG